MTEERRVIVSAFVQEVGKRVSFSRFARDAGISEEVLRSWVNGNGAPAQLAWKLVAAASKYGFFDVLPPNGLTSVSYDLQSGLNLLSPPLGLETEPPRVRLAKRPTLIAGYNVDFPIGLPASILAANAKWIKFYANRGFDILTYKTVRTTYREPHPWPNWVFLEDRPEFRDLSQKQVVVGEAGYWPPEGVRVSMANSFGVPSLEPEWWVEDVRRARESIREGHQVFIVSVVASEHQTEDAMANDFAKAAAYAKEAGAHIVEANYSCPNVPGDPVGQVYESPSRSKLISLALRDALEGTPLFVKIGYLPADKLRGFVLANEPFVNGIVAINTIPATVVTSAGHPTFPDRPEAGISGWVIKSKAQEVCRNLVQLRKELGREARNRLTILGVGGVTTPDDVHEYLRLGVDGVESCTGAFLDPHLAIKTRGEVLEGEEQRLDRSLIGEKNRMGLALTIAKKVIEESFLSPTRRSRIKIESNGRVTVDRE